ncbi:hypothetical protein QUF76_09940, partial [Desulfobacterales bacterium HSG16]|nr:hypothetical protein [Desulfobacterales bacterium HSG16]
FSERDGIKRLEEIRRAVSEGTFGNWLELVFLPLYGKEKGKAKSEIVEQVIRFEAKLMQAKKIPRKLVVATLIMSNKLIDKELLNQLWGDIKMLDILEVAREKGFEEGEIIGISKGIEKGEVIGIEKGKAIGISKGIEKGKAIGISKGIEKGKVIGIEKGKVIGIEKGKVIGIEKGKVIGIEKGKVIGIEKGKVIRTREILMDILVGKFGKPSYSIVNQVKTIDDENRLNSLLQKAMDCSDLKEFKEMLD